MIDKEGGGLLFVKLKKYISNIYLVLIFLFLYAPIFALVLFSFNDSKSMAKWARLYFQVV